MKTERRHDLKTNALARRLESFPDYWREYGNKVLLVVIVFLIAYLAVRYYNDKKARAAQDVANSLEIIQTQLGQLDQLSMSYLRSDAASLSDLRLKISGSAHDAINTILNSSRDPNIIAHAYAAQGDLDWKLANMPDPPGATTRPELKIPNRPGLLNDAKDAYSKVLQPPYNQNTLDVFSARLGLAAIAENQGQWDEAKTQYTAIADGNFPPGFREFAKGRLNQLPDYQKPVLLTPPPEASTEPSILGPEAPAMSQPASAPSMTPQPTTMPSASSQPATTQPR